MSKNLDKNSFKWYKWIINSFYIECVEEKKDIMGQGTKAKIGIF
jgi:hypothetical protein